MAWNVVTSGPKLHLIVLQTEAMFALLSDFWSESKDAILQSLFILQLMQ